MIQAKRVIALAWKITQRIKDMQIGYNQMKSRSIQYKINNPFIYNIYYYFDKQ